MVERIRWALHLPLLLALRRCSFTETATRDVLRAVDLMPGERTLRVRPRSRREESMLILRVFAQQPGTRTVFYHRLWRGTVADRVLCVLLKRLYRGQVGVELYCDDIGPGFVLAHGQGAIIGALRIGRDCTIHQEVAIGILDGDVGSRPTIGDRVWIYPGARVVGCNLGDDCTVGTNAVVLEDLPAGRTAFAPPARLAPY